MLIRRNHIVLRLKKAGALSPDFALTFEQAGVVNLNDFSPVTRRLVERNVIRRAVDGRYYVDRKRYF